MGLAMRSTMTYVVLRCVTNGMCNDGPFKQGVV